MTEAQARDPVTFTKVRRPAPPIFSLANRARARDRELVKLSKLCSLAPVKFSILLNELGWGLRKLRCHRADESENVKKTKSGPTEFFKLNKK